MTILLAIRIFGPIAVEPLAARLGITEIQLDWRLWDLENNGLVAHPTSTAGPWSVTEKGRREVDHHEVEASVRRDEARACVGVSQL